MRKLFFYLFCWFPFILPFELSQQMFRLINLGKDRFYFDRIGWRIIRSFSSFFLQRTVLTSRPWISLVHSFIAWAFILYMLVNIGDVLTAYIYNYHFPGSGGIGRIYRLFVDLFSVLAIRRHVYTSVTPFFFRHSGLADTGKCSPA